MLNLTYMKKKLLSSLFFFCIYQAQSLEMEPGLWKIHSTIEVEGKRYDPQAEYKKMINAVPAQQRKKVEQALQKSLRKERTILSSDGTNKLCYSKESLKNPSILTPQNKNCEMTLREKTAKSLKGSFVCLEKSTGNIEWNVLDRKKFQGIIIGKDMRGIESKTIQTGKFMSSSCGSLKAFKTR